MLNILIAVTLPPGLETQFRLIWSYKFGEGVFEEKCAFQLTIVRSVRLYIYKKSMELVPFGRWGRRRREDGKDGASPSALQLLSSHGSLSSSRSDRWIGGAVPSALLERFSTDVIPMDEEIKPNIVALVRSIQ